MGIFGFIKRLQKQTMSAHIMHVSTAVIFSRLKKATSGNLRDAAFV